MLPGPTCTHELIPKFLTEFFKFFRIIIRGRNGAESWRNPSELAKLQKFEIGLPTAAMQDF
jgi:hypothetical protein